MTSPAAREKNSNLPDTSLPCIADPDLGRGSFQKGSITEIVGSRSSGKTDLIMSTLAAAARDSLFCAIIDPTDSFDPLSAYNAGVELDHVLWIRCPGALDPALKSADYLLHAGGFGIVILDMADIRPEIVSKIPPSYWFRFRLAMENTQTVFLLVTPIPCAGSGCSASLQCSPEMIEWTGPADHRILGSIRTGLAIRKKRKMLRAGSARGRTITFSKNKNVASR